MTATPIELPAAPHVAPFSLDAFSAERLREIVEREGYLAALDALEAAIAATPLHAEFIRKVETASTDLAHARQALRRIRMLIVPGALYREYPATGADGQRFVQIVQQLGIPCDTLPIRSFAPCTDNAKIITDWLAAHPPQDDEQHLLISFSKGSADIKTALLDPRNHPPFQHIKGWLSVGGILHGTPLIAWLQSHPLRHFFVRLWLRLHRLDHRVLVELAHGPGSPLDTPTLLPHGLPLVHLIAMPTPGDLSIPLAKRAFHRLLPLGPNDAGGLLLADLARYPGIVYPVRGTDHYMRNRADIPNLLVRVLQAMVTHPPCVP